MPTSLITGGAGFLGSNLTGALLARGHKVIVLDNFMIGSRENLAEFEGQNLTIIDHDVREPLDSLPSFGEEKVDFIWNLACIASPVHYVAYPIETIETNTLGLPNVLNLARKTGAKVLHTSTSEIYGDPLEHPQKETYRGNVDPRGGHAMYKEAKRIAETIVTVYAQQYPELDVRMVRIFNTYGPKMALHDGRMLGEFLRCALTGESLAVDGEGSQTRSTCYVDDLIAGLLAMMDTGDVVRNEVVNLGNPDEHTVLGFAEAAIKAAGSVSTIEHKPARPDDVQRRKPDITKATDLLGWEPKVSLDEGLEKTIVWMRTKLEHQGQVEV